MGWRFHIVNKLSGAPATASALSTAGRFLYNPRSLDWNKCSRKSLKLTTPLTHSLPRRVFETIKLPFKMQTCPQQLFSVTYFNQIARLNSGPPRERKFHLEVCVCVCVCVCARARARALSPVQLFATLWNCSSPGSLVHGIFQARTRSGLQFPSPGIFLTQVLNLCLLCLLHCRRILYPLSQ